ncbi:hypothetical protein tinsulaeT_09840 [Thalassotalea insulae]|uniref:Methyltransferase type 11 domain-containing protein n=1 Tax=Thalassotalea insulae TaxID=2056778 RepID=A0ABQ6GQL9_9GAMM|nr:class I SAM-dependent methyltransferase [Thalassotalea insulae]GLX77644.1 hypothetical protein tinsulaeT_09840 [Thalassotalea insulae]
MTYSAAQNWNELYNNNIEIAYPAEGVIRIFKGEFPQLKMPKPKAGQSIIDVGCGDGRHLSLFSALSMESYGVEISEEIVESVSSNLQALNIKTNLLVGSNSNLPFDENFSDFLLSWNSCYYMSHEQTSFPQHVNELARVIKKGGWIICSIPKATSFIFDKSQDSEISGYKVIKNDFFNQRNGEIMRCFSSQQEIQEEFSSHFENFCFADIHMDWFGLNYHWHVFVAQKK